MRILKKDYLYPDTILSMKRFLIILFLFSFLIPQAFGQTYYPLSGVAQSNVINWSNINLITSDNDWSNIPYLRGFRGDGLTANTNVDPRTISLDGTSTPVVIYANQTDPNTFNADGFAEFESLSNPTIAFRASNTASAPFLMVYINTLNPDEGFSPSIRFLVRDIDGTVNNAAQQVSVQYRVGETGPFIPSPTEFFHVLPSGDYFGGYHPDASKGPFLQGHESYCDFSLPPSCWNQPKVQVRIMITNSTGGNEWIGIDDIRFSGVQTLPIKLKSFSLVDKNSSVDLNWSANTENISDNFEVENSNDGINFRKINSVQAKGTGDYNYSFTDISPLPGTSFYRLKLINNNGGYTYSNTLRVKRLSKDIYISSLYPSAATSKVNLIITSNKSSAAVLQIADLRGAIVKETPVKLINGSNNIPIDISRLPAGNYFIRLSVNESLLTERFLKL